MNEDYSRSEVRRLEWVTGSTRRDPWQGGCGPNKDGESMLSRGGPF